MCLIIFSPNINRARIRKAVLERAFKRNDDGAGMAFIEDGKIVVSKGYFDFPEFFLEYQRVRSRIHKGPLLIHFRRATTGSNTHTNTQPLVIYRGRLIMAHNGVFSQFSDSKRDLSDSVVVSRIIRGMGWNYPFLKVQIELLTRLCGQYSKLVFMNEKGRHTIINESLGKWWHGSWYSNEGAMMVEKRERTKVYGPSQGMSSSLPRYPNDSDYVVPETPGRGNMLAYANMTKEQREEFQAHENKMKSLYNPKPAKSPASFRRLSIIKDAATAQLHQDVDPDMMDDDSWRHWKAMEALRS